LKARQDIWDPKHDTPDDHHAKKENVKDQWESKGAGKDGAVRGANEEEEEEESEEEYQARISAEKKRKHEDALAHPDGDAAYMESLAAEERADEEKRAHDPAFLAREALKAERAVEHFRELEELHGVLSCCCCTL
jgi:hypothetical protein